MFISWAGPVCSYFPGYMTLRTYRLMPTSEVMFKFVYLSLIHISEPTRPY